MDIKDRTIWKKSLIVDGDVLDFSVVCWGGSNRHASVFLECDGIDDGISLSPDYEQEFVELLMEAYSVARRAREEA